MAIYEVQISTVNNDTIGASLQSEALRSLKIKTNISTTKNYKLEGISKNQAIKLAEQLLTDPIANRYQILDKGVGSSKHKIEVAYKPGVMNPEVSSIIKAAKDMGINLKAADSTITYIFDNKTKKEDINVIIEKLLINKTTQYVIKKPPTTLIHNAKTNKVQKISIRNCSNSELLDISKDTLFLNLEEMQVVKDYYVSKNSDPTDAELEIIAGRWSEHCVHKTFSANLLVDGNLKTPLFTRIKEAAKQNFGELVVSAFNDNSGVIKFYDDMCICGKAETHNSPSAVEPYGGAMTGSGGVFRDIMGTGKGAKTIISNDMFCFAPTDIDSSELPPGTLHPDYLQRRVVEGVKDYGNRMGIPTVNGSVHYHPDFRAKPTILVGAYGILPEKYALQGHPMVGDLVVIIGGRTGRDGIHGATFSSGEMTDKTADVNSSAVQIGNAIEEKRLTDALIECRDNDLIQALTDCGAAGFSSAIGEMGEETGVNVDISKAPLKYEGLNPWEIWMSESQERMVAAVNPDKISKFMDICKKYNVEATVIGDFDGSKKLNIQYGNQTVANLDYDFLINGLPQRTMVANWQNPNIKEIKPKTPTSQKEWIDILHKVLSHGDVCSKEPIIRQYDHGVQGGSIIGPYGGPSQSGPNDAVVIKPILDKDFGIVQSHGMNPILNRIDPYQGTIWAIAEAAANYVAVGGDIKNAAAVGNYIWPFPDEESLGSLDISVDAAVEMMHLLGLPVISGKDSLSSTYRSSDGSVIKIPPVYTMSIFGRIKDVSKTVTSYIKKPGESKLVLIGYPSLNLGGSIYYNVTNSTSSQIATINKNKLKNTLSNVTKAIQNNEILACHDISEGGLITTVSEMCFGGNTGATIITPKETGIEEFLFAESAGCFVVEVPIGSDLNRIFSDTVYIEIGVTNNNEDFIVKTINGEELIKTTVDKLKEIWQDPLKGAF